LKISFFFRWFRKEDDLHTLYLAENGRNHQKNDLIEFSVSVKFCTDQIPKQSHKDPKLY